MMYQTVLIENITTENVTEKIKNNCNYLHYN